MSYFNIRVYGLLINRANQVLLSDEFEYGKAFTKFPGGGLELGEGLNEALVREYHEECGIEITVQEHIHTTDEYVPSAFNDSQVIAIYYRVEASEEELSKIDVRDTPFDFETIRAEEEPLQVFRWVSIDKMTENDLTFEIDRAAWRVFTDRCFKN